MRGGVRHVRNQLRLPAMRPELSLDDVRRMPQELGHRGLDACPRRTQAAAISQCKRWLMTFSNFAERVPPSQKFRQGNSGNIEPGKLSLPHLTHLQRTGSAFRHGPTPASGLCGPLPRWHAICERTSLSWPHIGKVWRGADMNCCFKSEPRAGRCDESIVRLVPISADIPFLRH
jgi:hypothetical protein